MAEGEWNIRNAGHLGVLNAEDRLMRLAVENNNTPGLYSRLNINETEEHPTSSNTLHLVPQTRIQSNPGCKAMPMIREPLDLMKYNENNLSEFLPSRPNTLSLNYSQNLIHKPQQKKFQPEILEANALKKRKNEPIKYPRVMKLENEVFDKVRIMLTTMALGGSSEYIPLNEESGKFEIPEPYLNSVYGTSFKNAAKLGTQLRILSAYCEQVRAKETNRLNLALIKGIELELDSTKTKLAKCYSYESLFALATTHLVCKRELTCVESIITHIQTNPVISIISQISLSPQGTDAVSLKKVAKIAYNAWVSQLLFVLGLTHSHVHRSLSIEAKMMYFPDIFIDINENLGFLQLNESKMPSFVTQAMAHKVMKCLQIQSVLGPAKLGNVNPTLDIQKLTRDIHTEHRPNHAPIIRQSTSNDPFISPHSNSIPAATASSGSANTPPQEITYHQLRILMASQANYINISAKNELRTQLNSFLSVVFGLFMGADGVFWSYLCDILEREITSESVLQLNEIISENYRNVILLYDKKTQLFNINFSIPPQLRSFVKPDFIPATCQVIFNKIVDLYLNRQRNELLLYVSTFLPYKQAIEKALSSSTCGFTDVMEELYKVTSV